MGYKVYTTVTCEQCRYQGTFDGDRGGEVPRGWSDMRMETAIEPFGLVNSTTLYMLICPECTAQHRKLLKGEVEVKATRGTVEK